MRPIDAVSVNVDVPDEPELVVVVPTFNKADKLHPLLAALADQAIDPNRFEVVVVDDCSTDGTREVLERIAEDLPIRLRTARTHRNTGGPSAPRNIGWRSSQAPVVAFLDDDCVPAPKWLEAAVAGMADHPEWGVMQGRTVAPPDVDIKNVTGWQVARIVEGPGPFFEAANVFYRREALEKVGGFDEDIPTWGEDTDLGWRVLEAGWQRGFSNDAVVVHEVADRGWRYHLEFGWLDHHLIELAARHPQFRREAFWRPWCMSRRDAEFALALAGLALGPMWKPSAALMLPYLWSRRSPLRRGGINTKGIALSLQAVAVDAVRFAGHIRGSISARILVL